MLTFISQVRLVELGKDKPLTHVPFLCPNLPESYFSDVFFGV